MAQKVEEAERRKNLENFEVQESVIVSWNGACFLVLGSKKETSHNNKFDSSSFMSNLTL